ncbi:2Fe-2S iron-sulfur cluster-binding protein [Granulosicoccus sp.]|nr:2Fe-2S iron-sulfur cluster-binding protein [Granulosicoccus sp.]MDB4224393.1 2Fe-2S iron-sulfur cluster-binding protein [Granulosicoccus sp.]
MNQLTNSPRFYSLEVADVQQDTKESVILSFRVPPELKDQYTFTPGQYLTLRSTIDGQDIRRSYSICSQLGSAHLSVGIKRIADGQFSSYAQTIKKGEQLSVMTPQGRFTATIGGSHNYLLLAAGSGVTPILSIASSVLENEPDSVVTLCYANRNTESVMFRKQFDNLKDNYMTRFLLTHVMDEESQDVELFNGRLDAEKLETMATRGLITPTAYHAIYICGPQAMIEAVSAALLQLGAKESQIKFELFTPSTPLRTAGEGQINATDNSNSVRAVVEIVLDGSRRTFNMRDNETLLDAASRAGLDIPYSCANGMCATCRCKLSAGSGNMSQNFSLDPWEMEEGFVLACQLQPTSEKVVLDFDAV